MRPTHSRPGQPEVNDRDLPEPVRASPLASILQRGTGFQSCHLSNVGQDSNPVITLDEMNHDKIGILSHADIRWRVTRHFSGRNSSSGIGTSNSRWYFHTCSVS